MRFCEKCGSQMNDGAAFCPACGNKVIAVGGAAPAQAAAPVQAAVAATPVQPAPPCTDSKFTGGAFANFFIGLITAIIGTLSLGLLYPAMVCWKLRWKAKHTYVNGRRMTFDGKGIQLLGKFMLWVLLSIVTLGIYFIIAMPLNMKRWETKHTHFEGVKGESKFDGTILGLLGVNLLTGFVTIITFTLGAYWAHCYKTKWYAKHQTIDGVRLTFDGKGIQLFGKCIAWILLTAITFGIYSFWLIVKFQKWTTYHTHFIDPYAEPVDAVVEEANAQQPAQEAAATETAQ